MLNAFQRVTGQTDKQTKPKSERKGKKRRKKKGDKKRRKECFCSEGKTLQRAPNCYRGTQISICKRSIKQHEGGEFLGGCVFPRAVVVDVVSQIFIGLGARIIQI